MKILLTNDDGISAPGITTLYSVLSEDDNHEIYMVAPDGQRSATGRSITLYKPLFVTQYALGRNDIGLAVKGTPTDCIKLAVQGGLLPSLPDVIISGINDGPNLGTDIFYSGTVAAAMEGVLLGIPSLAVSLASSDCFDYSPSAHYIKEFLSKSSDLLSYQDTLLNINIPGSNMKEWKGIAITKLGSSVYHNTFEGRKAPSGKDYYWISGNLVVDEEEGTDHKAISNGYISVTPLHSDLTDYKRISLLNALPSFQEDQ